MENSYIKLSPSQARSLGASLLIFEKSLRKSNRLLEENDAEGFLYEKFNSLDSIQRNQVHKKIKEALKKLDLVVKKIGLEPRKEIIEQSIKAEMSISWANLIECRSDHFKGYGKFDPDSAMKLDAEIEPLVEISNEIFNLVTAYVKEKAG
jgi:hypothetical protein